MIALAARMKEIEASTILQRVAGRDKTAARDCIDAYGNFVWALARKFTRSREEAARATEEIFIDIWRYCERGGDQQFVVEERLIGRIALCRLIKFSRQVKQKSMASIDAPNEQKTGKSGISRYV